MKFLLMQDINIINKIHQSFQFFKESVRKMKCNHGDMDATINSNRIVKFFSVLSRYTIYERASLSLNDTVF